MWPTCPTLKLRVNPITSFQTQSLALQDFKDKNRGVDKNPLAVADLWGGGGGGGLDVQVYAYKLRGIHNVPLTNK